MQAKEVLLLLKKKHPDSYVALYDWFAIPAIKFLRSKKIDLEDANDILQETIIKVFEKLTTLKNDQKFESWIWQILRNNMNNFWNKNNKKNTTMFAMNNEDIENKMGDENIKIKFENEFSSKEDCVENKFKIFTQDMPDRAYVLELKMNQIADKEIALRINRTLAATKEFISQSRKKIAPYIEDCIGVENNE